MTTTERLQLRLQHDFAEVCLAAFSVNITLVEQDRSLYFHTGPLNFLTALPRSRVITNVITTFIKIKKNWIVRVF